MKRMYPYVVGALLLVVVVLIVPSLLKHDTPANQDAELAGVAKACALGGRFSSGSKVEAGVADFVKDLHAGASVSTEEVGALISKVTSDQSGNELYKAYTDCLQQQMAITLSKRGIKVDPPTNEDAVMLKKLNLITPETPPTRLVETVGQPISVGVDSDDNGWTLTRYQYKYSVFIADYWQKGHRIGIALATNDSMSPGDKLRFAQLGNITLEDTRKSCKELPKVGSGGNLISGICGGSHADNYTYSQYFFTGGWVTPKETESCPMFITGTQIADLKKCPSYTRLKPYAVVLANDPKLLSKVGESFDAETAHGHTFQWYSPEVSARMDAEAQKEATDDTTPK